jgi:release factor glutamine methyltransferase
LLAALGRRKERRFLKTVLEVITATTEYFAKAGVESPRLNIEHLLAHTLGKKRMDLYLEFDRPLSEKELSPLRELVKRRAAGEPLQYLLGTAEFFSHTLACDKRALIPRPETEQLCELVIAESKREGCPWKGGRIVDVGTGSGCIALALAAALPEATVLGVDISPDALALARENAARVGLADRVTFLESDLLERVDGPFGLMVANLPYIPSADVPGLQREVLFEPQTALDGGNDGLVIVRRLLGQAAEKLATGGQLALELHFDHPSKLAPELAHWNFRDTRIVKDYSGHERFVITTHG